MQKKEEKSDWYLTPVTAGNNINKVVERVRIERLPVCIDEIIVFGSFIKGKLHPHDIDVLFVKRKPQPDDYYRATEIYRELIGYFRFGFYQHYRYWTSTITMRLIRRGIKGVHPTDTDGLLEFIHELEDKERALKSGFPMKVVWSSSWEGELPRDKEHPLLPYLRFMQTINDAGVYGSMKKLDERIKDLSAYNGSDWKDLLNKEEKQCYDDTIYGLTEQEKKEKIRGLWERRERISKQWQYELGRREKEMEEIKRQLKELDPTCV